ncbi:hypothetical protein OGAPHI_004341 [Ogataea philodendri]|uniref:Uncharacterized protein n=1 Tax=Ogataea philodendri TaxID=1378263 RepID=A0A9P8P6H3_9ASCO|nr:uncharacterized protein OGAPHI_004341 [Ogataea philodendri]KAH3666152.1 hypothetical protein OGAPHI_004341 [Ogataea philodendri]
MTLKRSLSSRLKSTFTKMKKTNKDTSDLTSNPLDLQSISTKASTKSYMDEPSEGRKPSITESVQSIPSREVVLLPSNPGNENAFPCSPEQLTPILPRSSSELLLSPFSVSPMKVNNQRSLSINVSTINSNNNQTVSMMSPSFDIFDTAISKTETATSLPSTEPPPSPQAGVNDQSIFAKANQIDHFDKSLNMVDNDKLAEQMALHILDKISEEHSVDELSRLKDEVIHPVMSPILK